MMRRIDKRIFEVKTMKTLILYASQYGATREIARRIADRIDGAVIHNLKQSDVPSITEFDCVIIGSSLYAGMIRREAKAFLAKNSEGLYNKTLGLFLSGLEPANEQACFEKNFPSEILRSAKATCFPGGVYDPEKSGLLHKFMLKIAGVQMAYMDTIDNALIERFVESLRA